MNNVEAIAAANAENYLAQPCKRCGRARRDHPGHKFVDDIATEEQAQRADADTAREGTR